MDYQTTFFQALLEPVILIFKLPLILWRLYTGYFMRLSERKAVLARAGFGAFMLYADGKLAAHPYFDVEYLFTMPSDEPRFWAAALVVLLFVASCVWIALGFGWRGRGPRDGHMIFGFVVRIALGLALLKLVEAPPPSQTFGINLEYWLDLAAMWLLIPGFLKLFLVARGMPKPRGKPPLPPVVRGHGRAGIAAIQIKRRWSWRKAEENKP